MLKARSFMHGGLYQDLKISACVLLPIALGVVLSRLGVPRRAARGLFAFSFYGCQTATKIRNSSVMPVFLLVAQPSF